MVAFIRGSSCAGRMCAVLLLGATVLFALAPQATLAAWISIRWDAGGSGDLTTTGLIGAYNVAITPEILNSSGIFTESPQGVERESFDRQGMSDVELFDEHATADAWRDSPGAASASFSGAALANPRLLLTAIYQPLADVERLDWNGRFGLAMYGMDPDGAGRVKSWTAVVDALMLAAPDDRNTAPVVDLSMLGPQVRPLPKPRTLALVGAGLF